MKVCESAPGKLYLAGEYAVVEAGYPAVVAAMNQEILVTVESSEKGSLHSSQQNNLQVFWHHEKDQLVFDTVHPYALVESAMRVVEEYVVSCGKNLSNYQLDIDSRLDHAATGKKYGLGSSGAVTVAVVRALSKYYSLSLTNLSIYKLAVLAQMRLRAKGSFGDMAASSFGGLIAYYSVDKKWLAKQMEVYAIKDLLEMDWEDLRISLLSLPAPLQLLVGWTGAVASTEHLVSSVEKGLSQADKEKAHADFLLASRTCVETLILACQEKDISTIQQTILENRRLLQEFSKTMGIEIETDLLTKFCDIALEAGAVAKSSGAGGGDCGICFITDVAQKEKLTKAWAEKGIQLLDLSIAERKKEISV